MNGDSDGKHSDHPPQSLITDKIIIDLNDREIDDSSIKGTLQGKLHVFRIPGFTGISLSQFAVHLKSISASATGIAAFMMQFSDSKISSDSSVYPRIAQANLGIAFSGLSRGVSDGLRNAMFVMEVGINKENIVLTVEIHPVFETNMVDSSDFLTLFTNTVLVPDLE